MARRPISKYELRKQETRRARGWRRAKESVDFWKFRQLMDCIHWRDKALSRGEGAATLLPFVLAIAIAAFGLAAIALIAALREGL